jgi:putative drug exporter of the RND superfamily
MVCVFALFGTLSSLEFKQAGVGLAAAVLIDATPSAPCSSPRR